MNIIVNVMVLGDIMKHVAQGLSERGRLVLTNVIVCGFAARCVSSSLKTDYICPMLTREERDLFTNISV
jgi:hypothetical protein